LAVGSQPVHLDEGAGQLSRFPRRARLAGTQPYGDVLHPHRLAWPERQVADDAVALVEQTQHRHSLGHRRHAPQVGRSARHVDRHGLVAFHLVNLLGALAARHECQQRDRNKGLRARHA